MKTFYLTCFLFTFGFITSTFAQLVYESKQEVRGVWIATVSNLDWPINSTYPSAIQQRDLTDLFNRLQRNGINTVYFQVRSYCDALYQSNYEPWSRVLTGTQGKAPDPFWDPLSFAIKLAHDRGMELHAWLNPYRARTNSAKVTSDNSSLELYPELFQGVEGTVPSAAQDGSTDGLYSTDHVTVKNPTWIMDIGTAGILNPGRQEVIDYITDVTMDIVNRYDVDGIHFDDYFYPYPPNEVTTQDVGLFNDNPRGFTSIADWRRDNINRMIKSVHDSIMTVKPHVKYGISPFGIWKSGTPTNSSGMSAFSTIYADALAWMNGNYVDYIVPQLYWPFAGLPVGQDFGLLAKWWGTVRNQRHVYTGHGAYRSDRSTYSSGTLNNASEMPRQIRYTRADTNLAGGVFFRAKNIEYFSTLGLSDSLKRNYYRYPAFTPKMRWKSSSTPNSPQNVSFTVDRTNAAQHKVNLRWDRVSYSNGLDTVVKYAVYRITSPTEPNPDTVITNVRYLLALTGLTAYVDQSPGGVHPNWYFVTTINRNADESAPSAMVQTEVLTTSNSEYEGIQIPNRLSLEQNYPNPFNPTTTLSFSIPKNEVVTLKVMDMLGREVATVTSGMHTIGKHQYQFDASRLSSGIYFYTIQTASESITKKMVLIK